MGEVVTPFGRSAVPDPDQDTIDKLEELLAQAKRGELSGIAYAMLRPNGAIGTGWVGEKRSGNSMLGAVAALHVRYVRSWEEWANDE